MSRWSVLAALLSAALLVCGAPAAAPKSATSPETVLGTVLEFADAAPGPYQKGFLDNWRWTPPFREQAQSGSRTEIVADTGSGKRGLRVHVTDRKIFEQGALTLLRLAPFYPPEADVLRLHVKVLSGKVRVYAGGPTAYYANSDVYTRVAELAASTEPQTATIDLSLNHPLRRNFRRAGFSTDATRNYYSRWAQEPVGVFLDAGTAGEFILERIEVVSTGEGQLFPTFAETDIRTIKTIADFEAGKTDGVFHLYMADGETEWFEQSWKREKPLRFQPPELSIVADSERGTKSLVSVGPSAEEVHCTGIQTARAPDANAIRIALRHDAPAYRNTVVGLGPAEAVDFLVFVAPPNKPFRWQEFAASDELRKHAGPGFDYQFSYRAIRDRRDLNFAIYQTRRYLKPREWTTLVLPAADFACIYGSGTYRDRLLKNLPLSCDDVVAVAWLNPWRRVGGNGNVTLRFDELDFVHVPGTPLQLQSFWQFDPATSPRMLKSPGPYGGSLHMLLPGDAEPSMK